MVWVWWWAAGSLQQQRKKRQEEERRRWELRLRIKKRLLRQARENQDRKQRDGS
jgi:hypothetical protein